MSGELSGLASPTGADAHSALSIQFARDFDATRLQHLRERFAAQESALEDLKRRYLRMRLAPAERLEVRRRVAEGILFAATEEPWLVFRRYLRRLDRLGYSKPHILVMTAMLTSRRVPGSLGARKEANRLFRKARMALGDPSLPPEYKRAWMDDLEKASRLMEGSL